jgi:hypothetical protein
VYLSEAGASRLFSVYSVWPPGVADLISLVNAFERNRHCPEMMPGARFDHCWPVRHVIVCP